jgi:hypothetical protein
MYLNFQDREALRKIWTPRKTSQLKKIAKKKIGSSLAIIFKTFSVNLSTIKRKLDKEGLSYKNAQVLKKVVTKTNN